MSQDIILTMQKITKIVGAGTISRKILEDVYLSFFLWRQDWSGWY